MTGGEPTTELLISDEARAEAWALVRDWSGCGQVGSLAAFVDALAAAIQRHMNRAELAELERRQAVERLHAYAQEVRMLGQRGAIETWTTCDRCGARGPSVVRMRHRAGCSLSSAPPPRTSLPPSSGGEDG